LEHQHTFKTFANVEYMQAGITLRVFSRAILVLKLILVLVFILF